MKWYTFSADVSHPGTNASAEQPAELGEVIGGYRLDRVLGLGGMGCVYAGTHVKLGRKAAVKVLKRSLAADSDYVSRFFDEARVVNAIRHPNIIDIFDFIETEQPLRVACIMELINGPTLRKVLAGRGLSLLQAINLALQLAAALEAVHSIGVAKFAENQALGLKPKAADSLSFSHDCVKKVADLRYLFSVRPPGVRRQKEFRNNEEVFCIAFDRGDCRVHYLEL